MYYGFPVLVAATVGGIITAPGQSACIGKVIYFIGAGIKEAKDQVIWHYHRQTFYSAAALLCMGPVIDKFGPRRCVVAIALGLAYGCYRLAQVQSMEDLLIALFMLRFFGQGFLMTLAVVQINYWWVKRRNVMFGISGACVSLVMLNLVPTFMDSIQSLEDVRQTYTKMGAICVFFMAPWGFLWYRDRPERYGVQPDGEKGSSALQVPESWTGYEALCTCSFWVFAFAQLSMAMTYEALCYHFDNLFDGTLSASEVSRLKVFMGWSTILTQVVSGHILNRIEARWLMIRALLVSAASLLLACTMSGVDVGRSAVLSFGVLSTVSAGLGLTIFSVIYASYFGREHLGTIQTVATSFAMFGCAIGPQIWEVIRVRYNSFMPGFALGAFLQILCAFAVASKWARPLQKTQKGGYMAVEVGDQLSFDDSTDEESGN